VHKVTKLVGRSLFLAAALIVTATVLPVAPVANSQGIFAGTNAGTVVDPAAAALTRGRVTATVIIGDCSLHSA